LWSEVTRQAVETSSETPLTLLIILGQMSDFEPVAQLKSYTAVHQIFDHLLLGSGQRRLSIASSLAQTALNCIAAS
jgi:hypothetical protein